MVSLNLSAMKLEVGCGGVAIYNNQNITHVASAHNNLHTNNKRIQEISRKLNVGDLCKAQFVTENEISYYCCCIFLQVTSLIKLGIRFLHFDLFSYSDIGSFALKKITIR